MERLEAVVREKYLNNVPMMMVEDDADISDPEDEVAMDVGELFEEGSTASLRKQPSGEAVDVPEEWFSDEAATKGSVSHASSLRSWLERPGIDKEFQDMFRQGGWFNRIPRIDPSTSRPPNVGSRRPPDIDTTIWAGLGQNKQERELACREAEERGEGPPDIPPSVLAKLTPWAKEQVNKAHARAEDLTLKMLEVLEKRDAEEVSPTSGGPATPSLRLYERGDVESQPACPPKDRMPKPSLALAAHLKAWPEGEEARQALIDWCIDEGVPPPQEPREG